MKKHIFTLCVFFLTSYSYSLFAQHPTCNGSRYVSEVFASANVTTSVQFGSNTTIGGTPQNLMMDIYEPAGDVATQRPVIVLAFGGGFVGGMREDMEDFCRFYAKRGFVAVTIDYRLFDLQTVPSSTQLVDVVVKAMSDMKAAIRFLREDAATTNIYKIDPNMIFVGGISAGGVLSSHVAYIDPTDQLTSALTTAINANGGWEGNSSTNTQYSSSVQGVLNFSGALLSASYISTGEAPLFSAHDDGDAIVPYNGGQGMVQGMPIIYVEGSGLMHPRATTINIPNFLITIPNSTGHVSFFYGNNTATWQDTVRNTSAKFLHDNVICAATTNVKTVQKTIIQADVYPNPSSANMTINLHELPSNYSVTVYDQLGKVVYRDYNIASNQYQLLQSNFASGSYFLNIQFNDPTIAPIGTKVIFH